MTDRKLKSLRTGKRQEDFADLELSGFGVRVTALGKKTFFVRYRHNGTRPRMWLGTYPAVSLATARIEAQEVLLEVAKGGDPQGGRLAAEKAPTFAELTAEYLERHAKPKKRGWREDQRMLALDLLPAWAERKAHDVGRREVIAVLDRIVERGSPITANRTRALISKMFAFGIGRGMVEHNPVLAVPVPGKEMRRDRVLTGDELRSVWSASLRLQPVMGATFRLRLLTAQRGGEVLSMRWADIDGDWWTIPAERAKNGLPHRVPLASQSLVLLEELHELTGSTPWVFASPKEPTQHITAVNHAAERLVRLSAVDFVPHDLRRTAASQLASMGVPRLVISKILNHVDTGVTAVYDRHSYDREKREALEAWGARLAAILQAAPPAD